MAQEISYTLALTQPTHHLLNITLEVPTHGAPTVDLLMPAWTPGSYLIREYARHVQNFGAEADGKALAWRKVDKARWRVECAGVETIVVRYEVYGNELTVRTNHVDATHAHVIPAATFMAVDGRQHEQLAITVRPPHSWSVATGLRCTSTPDVWPGAGVATFEADNFDHLVDSPFEVGRYRTLEFSVDGKPHRIVKWGHGNEDDGRLVADAQRIVETQSLFWGGLPYEHYTFFLLLGGKAAGGGLEHRNSTSLLLSRFVFQPPKSYERYLTLLSHEFFHVWNVKRLRAEGLGPWDYSQETYTPLLWAMEGITEYYTDLLVMRAGLLTSERYLERIADDIVTLQATPGRTLQSLAASSCDTWIKFYRPDENSINTGVSYYLKGALVAMLLDLHIRQQTSGTHHLDEVMHALYERYPENGPGVPPAAYPQTVREVTGVDVADFFARYIDGVEELPFQAQLEAFGIKLEWRHKTKRHGGDGGQPTLGIRTKQDGFMFKVANVLSTGPAAGKLVPDDELVAFDGFRINDESTLNDRLAERRAGDAVQLTVFRREVLHTINVTLTEPPYDALRLVLDKDATPEQQKLREGWPVGNARRS